MMVVIDDDDRDDDDDEHDEDPYLYVFHLRFKSPVRPDWRCRGCVVIIIIMTVGDAEDARIVIIIIITVGDAEDAR